MSRLAAVGALCLAALIATGSARAQTVRLFTDWHAACDNLRTCSALGMAAMDAQSYAFIDIRRSGGANAEPHVSLAFTFETESPELPIEIAFEPAGADNVFPKTAHAAIGRDGLMRLGLPRENLAPFIAALRRADTLRVRRLDDAPKDQSSTAISLKGAVAALRWIDEQQLRNGNVTALIARGERAPAVISTPPTPPAVSRASYQVRQIEEKAPPDVSAARDEACPDLEDKMKGEEIGFQLTADTVLWQMPCANAAYNFTSVFFLQPRSGAPRIVEFQKSANGKLVRNLTEIVNGEFNEDERAIYFFSRGRGVGDCGVRGAYVWDGRAFVLTSWQEMTACRGAPLDLWPIVWRAETR